DAIKAGIEGLITFFETNARSRLDTAGADTLKGYERLFLTAIYLGKEADGAGGAKRITTGLSEELGRYGMGDVHPQLETLKGVGISLALDKASGGVKLLWDFFSQANSYSDEELAQRLVFGELEMFI